MSKHFEKAGEADRSVLDKAIKQYHQELETYGVRVGLVSVRPGRDDAGEPTGHAILWAGVPVTAKIRKTSPRERLWCEYDAVIEIDGDRWDVLAEDERLALLDHELTHIELVRDEDGHPVIGDDLRPKIRFKPDDWVLTGFAEVCQRHGKVAIEAQAMHEVRERYGQLVFDFERS